MQIDGLTQITEEQYNDDTFVKELRAAGKRVVAVYLPDYFEKNLYRGESFEDVFGMSFDEYLEVLRTAHSENRSIEFTHQEYHVFGKEEEKVAFDDLPAVYFTVTDVLNDKTEELDWGYYIIGETETAIDRISPRC